MQLARAFSRFVLTELGLRPRSLGCAAFTLLFTLPAWAITAPDTLPAGVRALGFVTTRAPGVNSTLNSAGYTESLVRPLNRSVTLDDFAAREPRLTQLRLALNSLGEPGLGESLLFANLYSSIDIEDSRTVAALFWGVTDNVSIGVIVPRITRRTRVDFRAEVQNNAAAIDKRLGLLPQLHAGLQELATTPIDTRTFEENIFTSKGYLPPRSFEVSGLGDVETEFRIRTFHSARVDLGVRATARIPTASHKPDLRNIFDRELGDGAWGFKIGSLHAVRLVPEVLTFHSAIFGTTHLTSKREVGLPADPSADLADLNDPGQIETVEQRLGNQVDIDAGLELNLWKSILNLSGSYQLSAKQRDRIRGTRGLDYERLMRDTEAVVHSTEWALEFSTIPLFMKQQVPLPAKISFTYHQPFAGRNTVYARYGRLDAILFF